MYLGLCCTKLSQSESVDYKLLRYRVRCIRLFLVPLDQRAIIRPLAFEHSYDPASDRYRANSLSRGSLFTSERPIATLADRNGNVLANFGLVLRYRLYSRMPPMAEGIGCVFDLRLGTVYDYHSDQAL